jgi:formylglycine-generating enzyme required for sulfatase activity
MPTAPALPEPFGRYRIVRQVGAGGMGAVYLAEDTVLGRRVALKVPHFDCAGPEVIERFYREARVAAGIEHPHVCPIYDVGQIDGIHYLTMPFIEGTPLSQRVGADGPWPPRDAVELVHKLALAIEVMHRRQVIHRDLKPGNVLLRPGGEPVLMDFGLARSFIDQDQRLTGSGVLVGTPAYMSPEQVRGEQEALGPGTDVYSLGVILYELLTGVLPFTGPLHTLFAKILEAAPGPPSERRPGLDSGLDALCLKALAKDPADRYGSMAEFAQALEEYLRQAELPPAVPGPAPGTGPAPAAGDPALTRVACPACGKKLKLPPGLQGKKVKCPRCGARLGTAGALASTLLPRHGLVQGAPTAVGPQPAGAEATPRGRRPGPRGRGRLVLAGGAAGVLLVILLAGWILSGNPGGKGTTRTEPPLNQEPQPPPPPAALAKEITNSIGMKLVLIPAGKFLMGSPPDEKDRRDDEEQHEVEITKPFYLGVYEVTQRQYEQVMRTNPSRFKKENGGGPDHPVENVSWQDAQDFCPKLSALEKERAAKRVYRLPTEAEWEYSCRGGARENTPFHFGKSLSSIQANFDGNYPYGDAPKGPYLQKTSPGGSYQPNGFGLFDMHGNVREWCADWYGPYDKQDKKDPQGPKTGDRRVLRGGSWYYYGRDCRAAYRDWLDPADRYGLIGFRVVCVPAARTP